MIPTPTIAQIHELFLKAFQVKGKANIEPLAFSKLENASTIKSWYEGLASLGSTDGLVYMEQCVTEKEFITMLSQADFPLVYFTSEDLPVFVHQPMQQPEKIIASAKIGRAHV